MDGPAVSVVLARDPDSPELVSRLEVFANDRLRANGTDGWIEISIATAVPDGRNALCRQVLQIGILVMGPLRDISRKSRGRPGRTGGRDPLVVFERGSGVMALDALIVTGERP